MGGAFLGKGWSFPPRFDPRTRGVQMVAEEDDIAESLRILFSTHPGDRVMQPSYGCALRAMVFEPLHEHTVTALKDEIQRAILFFEPRIQLDALHVDIQSPQEGRLNLRVEYTVRTTNTRHNLVFPLCLQQGTDPVQGG